MKKSAFRRRWFALRHNNLMYFKYQKSDRGYGTGNHDTAGRAGIIDMSTVQNVQGCFDDNCPDNCIALQAVNRTYYLVVPGSDDDFDELGYTPYATRLFGEPMVIYRDISGNINAVADACPHRSAPLSMGDMKDGTLRCFYHGWGFGEPEP